jgi:hypothetical protein
VLIGPLETIVGREARINAAARSTSLSPRESRIAKQQQENDQDYLKFLARNIESSEQFETAVNAARPQIRAAVRAAIIPHLPANIRAAVEVMDES